MTIERLVDAKARIGEGPIWDERLGCLYWVDILGCTIHRTHPNSTADDQLKLDKMVGAVALCEDGSLVAALEDGFARIRFETGLVEPIWTATEEAGNRFNDGKCDPDGRFWAGTMSLTGQKNVGSLYCLQTDLSVATVLGGVSISNGLAWTDDKKYLYYIDSPTREIWRFDYDPSAPRLTGRTTVVRIPDGEGVPDGMTIDREGNLWVAQWGGGRVSCFNPRTGKRLDQILFPVSQVSSCTFGGPDLGDLYVTTAWNTLPDEARRQQPEAGALYRVRTQTSGFPADRFRG